MQSAFAPYRPARLVLLLLLTVGFAAALQPAEPERAQAQQPDAAAKARRLDELFDRLKATQDEGEADTLVAQIWAEWLHSGTKELDERMEQAATLMDQGVLLLALPTFTYLIQSAPDWAEAWNKRATAYYLAGEHDLSLADIDRVLALEPRHFGALAGMGLIYMARGQYRDALAAYRRALAVNPFLKERFKLIPELERLVGEQPI
jgi:tetratricopeptide (TPR) repeat protein